MPVAPTQPKGNESSAGMPEPREARAESLTSGRHRGNRQWGNNGAGDLTASLCSRGGLIARDLGLAASSGQRREP
jgi:hypothetical protein